MADTLYAGAGVSELLFPEDYFPSDGFSGAFDAMHCKALLLKQGDACCAVITFELPSVRPWERTDALRQYAADQLRIPYEHTWLVMTHDLSAPHVPPEPEKAERHMTVLRQAAAEACQQAVRALQPARLYVGEGSCGINANRDMPSADGWWVGVGGTGPSVKKLSLWLLKTADGRRLAALYSYAVKSSVLEAADMSDGKRYASGDVTGLAGSLAEKALGCPVLFVMGAAGDQVPRVKGNYLEPDALGHFRTVQLREKARDAMTEMGRELARAVEETARSAVPCPEPALRLRHHVLRCPAKKPYPKTLPPPPVLHYEYEPDGEAELDIWQISLGETALLGVKAEVTTPIFEAVRAASPVPHPMLATLVNGGQGYIATDPDYQRFTYPGLNTPFRPGADRAFISEALRMLGEDASHE